MLPGLRGDGVAGMARGSGVSSTETEVDDESAAS